MSLRLRLTLLITWLLILGIAAGMVRVVLNARTSIVEEVNSSFNFTLAIVDTFIGAEQNYLNTEVMPELMQDLERIGQVRHVELEVFPADSVYQNLQPSSEPESISAPAWFVNLVRPQVMETSRQLGESDGTLLLIRTDPSAEIEEIWGDTKATILWSLVAILIFNAILLYLITRWLKPLESIVEVLDQVQYGDFSRRIPAMRLPELNLIADKVNRLTSVLGASKSDNERLTRKALDIQERERRNMVQELHDALGQSVSAIKAIAVSIAQRSRGVEPAISQNATEIEQIADKAYNSVRVLISQLRPSVLDELGLVVALQQMTDDWNDYHENTFCKLRVDGDFDTLKENQQINIYRIVQEALTNIAKHANADEVNIILSGKEVISLIISDNGRGFDPEQIEKGMGLASIRERVQTLRGELSIITRPGEGVTIQIELPRLQSAKRRRATDAWAR